MHVEWTWSLFGIFFFLPPTVWSCEALRVLEGGSVILNVTRHVDSERVRVFEWRVNKTNVLSFHDKTVDITTSYKGRVEFDEESFSLRLKSLMKNDSGHYEALQNVEGKPKESVADCYISVLEPAVAPSLTVESNWSSSDSCRVTLNCSAGDLSLISSSNSSCYLEAGKRCLSLSFNHSTAVCNHSNPVDWKHVELKTLCSFYGGHQKQETYYTYIAVAVALVSEILMGEI